LDNQPNNHNRLTADDIEVRIWAFVIIIISLILFFIVVSLIYRTTFVSQPIKQISPMDAGDQKMLNDIVLLLVGVIGAVAGVRKGVKGAAEMIAAVQKPVPPTLPTMGGMMGAPMPTMSYGMSSMPSPYTPSFVPQQQTTSFDNSWTPPPGPTNPPHHLESDEEREALAAARQTTRGQ
jgi:hypothetical protein